MKYHIKNIIKNKTLVNGSLFAMFSFFNKGMAFILLIVIANYIEPAAYGQLSLFTTIVTLLGYFVALSCQGYIEISFFKRKEKFSSDLSSILLIAVVNSVLFCIIALLLGNKVMEWTQLPKYLLFFAIAISFFAVAYHMLLSILRVKEKVLSYGMLSCGYAVLNFVVTLICVIGLKMGWMGRVYTYTISAVVFGMIGLIVFAIKKYIPSNQINTTDLKTIIRWGIPLIPHLAATWIKQGGDRFIINGFYTLEEVGYFSFALNLLSVISILGLAFNSTNSVSIYQILSSNVSNNEKRKKLAAQTKQIRLIYTLGTVAIVVGVLVVVPFAVPRYASSLPYFLILSISGFFHCLYLLYCNYLFYYSCNKKIMNVTFVTSILHLSLSFALTRFSLYFTCGVYTLSSFIIFLMIKHRSIKVIEENLKD